ncbi:hypothetical protein Gotur_024277 [Gossypium turneri]
MPEAQKFRTSGIDPEFEGKLDQMFMGIVATENEEENMRNDVHILNDVHISNDV